jgi:hypothetical protein
MRVLVVGSLHYEGADRVRSAFTNACMMVGAALGRHQHEIVVGSDSRETADRYIIEGLSSVPGDHRVFVYRPDNRSPFDARRWPHLVMSVHQAGTSWATGRSLQIRAADVVLVIGGGRGTQETIYAVPVLHRPMLVITSFGGAAGDFAKGRTIRPEALDPSEQVEFVDASFTNSVAEQTVLALERLAEQASSAARATAEADGTHITSWGAPHAEGGPTGDVKLPPHYPHLRKPLLRFFSDTEKGCERYDRNVFIMMPFGDSETLSSIESTIRDVLKHHELVGHRADDRMYPTDRSLWDNVCTYMFGCKYGVAVLENLVVEEFNPNVALEYGFMRALDKQCLLLKDRRFKPRADITGTLAEEFDMLDPKSGVSRGVERWIVDLNR